MSSEVDFGLLALTNPHPYGFTVHHANRSWLRMSHPKFSSEVQDFLDCCSGIAVNNLGHRYPAIVESIKKQTEDYLHTMVYGELVQAPQIVHASELVSGLNVDYPLRVWFSNSGAEANDTALKLAQLNALYSPPKRFRHGFGESFFALEGGFHGRSIGSLGVTWRNKYREPFEELYAKNYCKWVRPGCTESELRQMLNHFGCKALILELVQGENGVRPLDEDWVYMVEDVVHRMGGLLIVDEVQTGMGRTGQLFALHHYPKLRPDIVTLGKAVGGGLPLGACIARAELMDLFDKVHPFSHLTTFGGNPVSCSAGVEMLRGVLQVLEDVSFDKFVDDLWMSLEELVGKSDKLESVSGVGMMIGLHFTTPDDAHQFVESCWRNQVFVGHVLHDDYTVRFYPPINVYRDVSTHQLMTILEEVLDDTEHQ